MTNEQIRVLVVEDDADTAQYVRTVLERRGGMAVTVVHEPMSALAEVAAHAVRRGAHRHPDARHERAGAAGRAALPRGRHARGRHDRVRQRRLRRRGAAARRRRVPGQARRRRDPPGAHHRARGRGPCQARRRGQPPRSCWRSARTPTTWRSASARRSPRTARPATPSSSSPCPAARSGATSQSRRHEALAVRRHHRRAPVPARLRGHPARPRGRAHHDDRGAHRARSSRPSSTRTASTTGTRTTARSGRPSTSPPAASRRSRASRARRRPSTSGPPGSCRSTASSRPSCRCSRRSSRSRTATTWSPTSCGPPRATGRASAAAQYAEPLEMVRAAAMLSSKARAARRRRRPRHRDGRRARRSRMRVLVTGAGGPAGVAVIRSLLRRGDVEVIAADMDRWASALYLVDAGSRHLVPAGRAADFVDVVRGLCRDERVDVLFPTVDVELPKLAAARDELLADGTILASPVAAHARDLPGQAGARRRVRADRAGAADRAARHAAGGLRLGLPGDRQAPPRRRLARGPAGRHAGRARRGARRRRGPAGPGAAARRRVLGRRAGRARRPRDRRRAARPPAGGLRASRSPGSPCTTTSSIETASAVARAIGLTTVANVQLKRDADGRPGPARGQPAVPRRDAADHRRRRRHAVPHARRRARPARAGPRRLPGDRERALPRGRLPADRRRPAAHDEQHGPATDGDHHVHSTFSDDAVSTPAENLGGGAGRGPARDPHGRPRPRLHHVRPGVPRGGPRAAAGRRAHGADRCRGQDPRRVRRRRRPAGGARRARHAGRRRTGSCSPTTRSPDRTARGARGPPGSGSTPGLDPADVVEMLVTATIRAMHAVGRAQLAHPFSVLPKIGLTEDDVPDELLDALADAAVATGTPVEVNEKWHCPGPRVAGPLAGGRACCWSRPPTRTTAADVGVYDWVQRMSECRAATCSSRSSSRSSASARSPCSPGSTSTCWSPCTRSATTCAPPRRTCPGSSSSSRPGTRAPCWRRRWTG